MNTATLVHSITGLPIQSVPTYEVGDLVTEHIASDGYPAVVVHVTPKTVWVRKVSFIGNYFEGDAPGLNGYGDSGVITVDPDSIDRAVAAGRDGASKYVLYVNPRPSNGASYNERQRYGRIFHRAKWRQPGAPYTGITPGARYRRDPHV